MTKNEFLLNQISECCEEYRMYGNSTKNFAILYDDGTTKSIGTSFQSPRDKKDFNYFMRMICTNPKVIACTFTSEVWISKSAEKENKRPSECGDREEMIVLVYSTQDNEQKLYLYKSDKNGNLELENESDGHHGRFCNPFSEPIHTSTEKDKIIEEFQVEIRETLCQVCEKLKSTGYMLIFLTDTKEQVCVQQLSEDKWEDREWLFKLLQDKCQELETMATIVAFPEGKDLFKIVLVTRTLHEEYIYNINYPDYSLEYIGKKPYEGEFSGIFQIKKS
ncbi:MAG: hypothetical protein JXB49_13940 [Bacteroidales bacterium]|nr:hypothetical protein [Bacteroidales bacterium]